jgi:hypothetical protein
MSKLLKRVRNSDTFLLPSIQMFCQKLLSIIIIFIILSSLAYGFDTAPHFDLTRSVLHEHGFDESAIKITQVENWLTDYYSNTPTTSKDNRAKLEKLHFDNLFTTKEVENNWGWLINNLKIATRKAAKDDDPLAMLTIIGVGLHAAQDFYSHSNWVETHPRLTDGSFQTRTILSTGAPIENLFTGKYPADRKIGFDGKNLPVDLKIHGDYRQGVNKDSPVREHWAEAYVFAYCASFELVEQFEKWADEIQPGFWKKVRQFQINAEESKALDYDLRAVRNISMWAKGQGVDGHWKGDKSGLARFFDIFTPKWMSAKTSLFVKQISEGDLPKQLSQNLYTSDPAPKMPLIKPFSLKKRAILLYTTLIKETDDVGFLEPKIDPRGKADFYPIITIDGQIYQDRILQDFAEFKNPWLEIHIVDDSISEVPIKIAVKDEDDTDADGFYQDDVCDINPKAGKTDLDLIFRLKDGSLFGDINGIFSNELETFTTAGAKPDKNRALLKAYLTQFTLR